MSKKLINRIEKYYLSNQYELIVNLTHDINVRLLDDKEKVMTATALNNSKSPNYLKALDLLDLCSYGFQATGIWNYQMGLSLFYLQREVQALQHFKKASAFSLYNDDTKILDYYISSCISIICNPIFIKPFSKRVNLFWLSFLAKEKEIIQMIDFNIDDWCLATHHIKELLWTQFDNLIFDLLIENNKEANSITLIIKLRPSTLEYILFKHLLTLKPKILTHWSINIFTEEFHSRHTNTYSLEPNKNLPLNDRNDIFMGITNLKTICDDYLKNECYTLNQAFSNGIIPGYFYYSTNSDYDVYDDLVEQIASNNCIITGNAIGLRYNYIDVLILNYENFIEDAKVSLKAFNIDQLYFKIYIEDATPIEFIKKDD